MENQRRMLHNIRDEIEEALTSFEKARYNADTLADYFDASIQNEDKAMILYCFDKSRIVSNILCDYLLELQKRLQTVYGVLDEEIKKNKTQVGAAQ